MATVRRTIPRPQADVFAALITPETYPHWLVGCQDIRAVDAGWPAPGTAFHHRVGLFGPVTVADNTVVEEIAEPHCLKLEVRARPLGRGCVTFTLEAADPGETVVTLEEEPIGLLAPAQPLIDPITARRNERSLTRLADYLAADRALHEVVP